MEKFYPQGIKRRPGLFLREKRGLAIPRPALTILAVFLCLFLGSTARATTQTLINDNFETYNFGNISGQGYWKGSNDFQVSGFAGYLDTRGIDSFYSRGNSIFRRFTHPNGSTSADLSFYISLDTPATTLDIFLLNEQTGDINNWSDDMYAFIFEISGGRLLLQAGTGPYDLGPVPADSLFHKYQFSFTPGGFEYFKLDNGDWIGPSWRKNYTAVPLSDLDKIAILQGSDTFYFDNISGGSGGCSDYTTEADCSGDLYCSWDPILEKCLGSSGPEDWLSPTYPADCIFNYSDIETATATGKFYNPLTSGTNWTDISIILENASTSISTSTNYIFPSEIIPGSIGRYSFPFSIPEASSTYRVSYLVSGYFATSTSIFNNYYSYCPGTYLGPVSPGPNPPIVINPEYPALEDCSGFNWITDLGQRLFCETKNFIYINVFPSTSKIQELKDTIGEMSGKFPINYISADINFFKQVNSGLSGDHIIRLGLFGRYSTTSLTILENNITYSGITLSINDFIKLIITFFLIVGFTIWAIWYIRGIL